MENKPIYETISTKIMSIKCLKKALHSISKGTKLITSYIKETKPEGKFRNHLFENVLLNHPTRNFNDIEYLQVKIRPPFMKKSLYIKCKDKEIENISYKLSIQNIFGKYNPERIEKNNKLEAFRNTIYETKRKIFYKEKTNKGFGKCENCFKEDKLDIDHYKIPFSKILDDFLLLNDLDLLKTPIQEEKTRYKIIDNEIKNKWIEYHDDKVIYKCLCKTCNCSLGDYGYKKNKNK